MSVPVAALISKSEFVEDEVAHTSVPSLETPYAPVIPVMVLTPTVGSCAFNSTTTFEPAAQTWVPSHASALSTPTPVVISVCWPVAILICSMLPLASLPTHTLVPSSHTPNSCDPVTSVNCLTRVGVSFAPESEYSSSDALENPATKRCVASMATPSVFVNVVGIVSTRAPVVVLKP